MLTGSARCFFGSITLRSLSSKFKCRKRWLIRIGLIIRKLQGRKFKFTLWCKVWWLCFNSGFCKGQIRRSICELLIKQLKRITERLTLKKLFSKSKWICLTDFSWKNTSRKIKLFYKMFGVSLWAFKIVFQCCLLVSLEAARLYPRI